jgi:hypothetical protein
MPLDIALLVTEVCGAAEMSLNIQSWPLAIA